MRASTSGIRTGLSTKLHLDEVSKMPPKSVPTTTAVLDPKPVKPINTGSPVEKPRPSGVKNVTKGT